MKTITFSCKKCSTSEPVMFYHYQPRECKSCTRARVLENRANNVEYYRDFDRRRGSDPSRRAQYITKQKRKRADNPFYNSAHLAVGRAVAKGVLVRPDSCARCDAIENIQAHHDDHKKPLDVMWLCPVCHAARHKELRRLSAMSNAYGKQPSPF